MASLCLPHGAMAAAAGELLASYIPPWLRRSWLRRLYDQPGAAFDLEFTDRGAAQIVFDEGQGSLLTDGTRACMEKSHILYDQELDSVGTLPAGARGLLLKMDNTAITCGHDAKIAVGHLASWSGYTHRHPPPPVVTHATHRHPPAPGTASATSSGSHGCTTRRTVAGRPPTRSRASRPTCTAASRTTRWPGASRPTTATRCTWPPG